MITLKIKFYFKKPPFFWFNRFKRTKRKIKIIIYCEQSEQQGSRSGSYCEQSEQQGSASEVLIFNVIIKNKVLNYFLTNKVSLEITKCFYLLM